VRTFGPRPRVHDFGFSFAAATNVTDIGSVQNNTGQDLLILPDRGIFVLEEDSGVTVDLGIAADAATNGDNLIDGQSIATANTFVTANGTNGAACRVWAAGTWVNLKKAGGTISGISGRVVLPVVPYTMPT
jgi:hypothetical protein